MASLVSKQRGGFLIPAKTWQADNITPVQAINQSDAYSFGATPTTIATLLGSGKKAARSRQAIYEKWALMGGDGIISTSLGLIATAALGGHETNGNLVFIEKKSIANSDKKLGKLVDEINKDLTPLLNRVAFAPSVTAMTFGDAYARIYSNDSGVVDLYIDEMVRPELIVPIEKGSKTIGYFYFDNASYQHGKALTSEQMARLKMPRVQWTPQTEVIQKSYRYNIHEDDLDNLSPYIAMAGGSFLYNAEEHYDNLIASLLGLVGQRWMDSISEEILGIQMESTTEEQQKKIVNNWVSILQKSKSIAENAVKNNSPVLQKIRHLVPIFGEKQVVQLNPMPSGRNANISIEDVMLHAKLLSGALGVDLSMIGFADLLAGGLGEGGFFRTSSQVAERARVIRCGLADFFNHIIDIHTLKKYGSVFPENERPWEINFYGSMSALEAEKQRTQLDAINTAMLKAQTLQMVKDLGFDRKMAESFLSKDMLFDEDRAKLFAAIVEQQATMPTEEV
jgi:hypothetical protein